MCRLANVLPLMFLFVLVGAWAMAEDRATHDGTVKSAAEGKLVVLDKTGKETTFTVPEGVPVTIHGKASKLEELKSGTLVRVTTGLKGEVASITTVEPLMEVALDK